MYTAPDYPQGVCHIRKAAKLPTAVQSAGLQLFKLQACNVGGRGVRPSSFSGGYKGGILFEKRIPPLTDSSTKRCIPLQRSARRYILLQGK